MTRAHFLIAGAQRAGTTLLLQLLDQHPEIEMARPIRPEPKFFLRQDASSVGLEGYRRLFGRKPGAKALGEKSTTYLERHDVAETVVSLLPDAKVVVLLRDPVERALSNYRFSQINGVETARIEEALLHEDERNKHYDRSRFSTSPFAYVSRGHYVRYLDAWSQVFGPDRLLVLLLEELVRDPAVLQNLFHWLEVSTPFFPQIPTEPVNPAGIPTSIDFKVRRFLADQFIDSNLLLAERYGLDLSLWQR